MRRIAIFVLFVLTITMSTAQNINGKIIYKSVVNLVTQNKKLENPDISLQEKKELEKQIKFMRDWLEKTYVLKFNSYESLYSLNETISLSSENEFTNREDGGDFYKNLKDKVVINVRDNGTLYLVADSLENFNWRLHSDTKQIGKYTCHKATFTETKHINRARTNENGGFENYLETKVITTTAWYTPQISISNGPEKYGGLPGLILEVGNDFAPVSIKCTEIILNPKKTIKIKKPRKGKIVTRKEFREEINKFRR